MASLVSINVRREAREYLVSWPLGAIGDLFRGHGFVADLEHEPQTTGERRTYVEQFYATVGWSDRSDVERMLGVFEALIDDAEVREASDPPAGNLPWSVRFTRLLARDGFDRDTAGRLRPRWEALSRDLIRALPEESAIPMLLGRMWANVNEHPDAAIGAAKELIEATAKHILGQLGEPVADAEKMPSLIARTHDALSVHAKAIDDSKPGSDSIKAVLGSLSKVAAGINELRRDYGSGHGRVTRSRGLSSRHARLAAHAADAWSSFMLETHRSRIRDETSRAS